MLITRSGSRLLPPQEQYITTVIKKSLFNFFIWLEMEEKSPKVRYSINSVLQIQKHADLKNCRHYFIRRKNWSGKFLPGYQEPRSKVTFFRSSALALFSSCAPQLLRSFLPTKIQKIGTTFFKNKFGILASYMQQVS